jgi:hypothetical protein
MRIAILVVSSLASSLFASSCSLVSSFGQPAASEDLAIVAAQYLEAHLFEPSFGGQVFCATEMLHVDQQGTAIKAYVWAMCIEYYEDNQILQAGSAASEPLLVYMIEYEGSTLATGFAEPRGGSLFAEDIKRIFPDGALAKMCLEDIDCKNARRQRLEAGIEEQVKRAYNLPIATRPGD